MRLLPFFRAAALALLCMPAFSQVSIDPPNPTSFDTVRVQVPMAALPDRHIPQGTRVTMAANKVTVELGYQDFIPLTPDSPVNWPIGVLPAGTYQLEVRMASQLIGTSQFTVTPRSSLDPLWNHTDMWWNPAESGWGISVVHHPSGVIFATFFLYGQDNKPVWYVVSDGAWQTQTRYVGTVYRTTGPPLDNAFNPSAVTRNAVGTATFDFSDKDPDRANLVLTVDGRTIERSLRRQGF
jgi:hypothetical protein